MIGFLAGAGTAAVLALVTWAAMATLYVPTEARYDGPNVKLDSHLVEETVGGD